MDTPGPQDALIMTDATLHRVRRARASVLDQLADARARAALEVGDLERQLADCDRALAGDESAAVRVLGGTTLLHVDDVDAEGDTIPPPTRDYPGSRPPRSTPDGT